MLGRALSLGLILLAACDPPRAAAPPSTPPSPAPEPAPLTSAAAAPAPTRAPSAAPLVPPPSPPPSIPRSGEVWPFHAWTRAEVIGFNQFPMKPSAPRWAYGEKGWSPHVASRKAVDVARAKAALEIARITKGEVSVSKCPFPRHAVVFFDGEVPVGSVNVCFECGDIDAWPSWDPYEAAKGEPARKRWLARQEEKAAAQPKALARWKTFFREEGLDVDTTYGPPRLD